MENGQSSPLNTLTMPPEDVLRMADDLDRHLTRSIGNMQEQGTPPKYINMGRDLYLLILESSIIQRINAMNRIKKRKGLPDKLAPEKAYQCVLDNLLRREKPILFERVNNERYPIRIDFNAASPTSVTLIY